MAYSRQGYLYFETYKEKQVLNQQEENKLS